MKPRSSSFLRSLRFRLFESFHDFGGRIVPLPLVSLDLIIEGKPGVEVDDVSTGFTFGRNESLLLRVTEFDGKHFFILQNQLPIQFKPRRRWLLTTLSHFYVLIAVCDGIFQQTIRQIQGGSQTDVSEDHLQVADLRFGLLWSQGEPTLLLALIPNANAWLLPTHRLQTDIWLGTRTLNFTWMLFSKPQSQCFLRFSWSPSTSMESVSLTQRRRLVWEWRPHLFVKIEELNQPANTCQCTNEYQPTSHLWIQTGHTDCTLLH